jgi:hypothetical protein
MVLTFCLVVFVRLFRTALFLVGEGGEGIAWCKKLWTDVSAHGREAEFFCGTKNSTTRKKYCSPLRICLESNTYSSARRKETRSSYKNETIWGIHFLVRGEPHRGHPRQKFMDRQPCLECRPNNVLL